MKKLKVGMPEDNCDITPVVSQSSANFVQGLVEDAQAKGAKLHQEWKRENNLIWPVLIDHVTPDMRIAWEEPKGSVAAEQDTTPVILRQHATAHKMSVPGL
jgi:glyceraldehyde-3-phosphate dehydrogenase (NADP+)